MRSVEVGLNAAHSYAVREVTFCNVDGKGLVMSLMTLLTLQGKPTQTHRHTYTHTMHLEQAMREQAMCLLGFVCVSVFA